jgi:hypothetical protein
LVISGTLAFASASFSSCKARVFAGLPSRINLVNKNNAENLGGEQATSNSLSADLKYNVASKGSFQTLFKVTDIKFNGDQNTPVAFEMQEGLRTGRNFTWNLSYQRTLSNNMQLNISYDGRKSPDVNTVHVGNVQVRVFF